MGFRLLAFFSSVGTAKSSAERVKRFSPCASSEEYALAAKERIALSARFRQNLPFPAPGADFALSQIASAAAFALSLTA